MVQLNMYQIIVKVEKIQNNFFFFFFFFSKLLLEGKVRRDRTRKCIKSVVMVYAKNRIHDIIKLH